MRSFVIWCFFLTIFPTVAFGQTILLTNTTWATGSVINSNSVEIAPGVTLTIEPGVVVTNVFINVYGTLRAVGTPAQKISFNDTYFMFGQNDATPGYIEIRNADINGGEFIPTPSGYGSFDLTDSILTGVNGFYIWYPTGTSRFERNVFVDSAPLQTIRRGSASIYVTNNVFSVHRVFLG